MANILSRLTRIFNRHSTAELRTITDAIDSTLNTAANDVFLLDLEYIITSATGKWLDEWGSWFAVPRMLNEPDEIYRNRIIANVSKPKSTVSALIQTTRAYMGDPNANVYTYEPFNNIAKFNVSTYSGPDKFQDSNYYRLGVIDLIMPVSPTDGLRDTLNQSKSAGTGIYYTILDQFGVGDATQEILSFNPNVDPIIENIRETQIRTMNLGFASFSSNYGGTRSGSKTLWFEGAKESHLLVALPIHESYAPMTEIFTLYYPSRSIRAFRSNNSGGLSGYPLTEFDKQNPIDFKYSPVINLMASTVSKDSELYSHLTSPLKETQVLVPRALDLSLFGTCGGRLSGGQNLWVIKLRETELLALGDISVVPPMPQTEIFSMAYPARSGSVYRSENGGLSGYPLTPIDEQSPMPFEVTTAQVVGDKVDYTPMDDPRAGDCIETDIYVQSSQDWSLNLMSGSGYNLFRSGDRILSTVSVVLETNLFASLRNRILAGSEVVIQDVQNLTVSEIDSMLIEYQPDPVSISMPV